MTRQVYYSIYDAPTSKPEGQPAEKNARKPILKVRVFCVRQGCISFFFHSTNLGFGLLVFVVAPVFGFLLLAVLVLAGFYFVESLPHIGS